MKFPKLLKITSRTSSITNSFVQAIIPSVKSSRDEVEEALAILGMTLETIACAYCGGPASDWDHLRPLVRKRQPTGYISEIRNLVPSCGPCNQSKSGADWRSWMLGSAAGSPRTRGISDLEDRVERLAAFERWGEMEPLPFRDMAGADEWESYWANLEVIEEQMREAQKHADRIRIAIFEALNSRSNTTKG